METNDEKFWKGAAFQSGLDSMFDQWSPEKIDAYVDRLKKKVGQFAVDAFDAGRAEAAENFDGQFDY